MDKMRQAATVTAICLSIIIAGTLIAYRPGELAKSPGLPSGATGPGVAASGLKPVSEGTATPHTLSVSGTGTVTVKPDQAVVVLGVYTEDREAARAIDENAAKMSGVVKALKALGIAEADMETAMYIVQPVYNWEVKQTVGYQVTNTLRVKVNDLTKVGKVIDAAATGGANKVDSVSFVLSDATAAKIKLQAYDAAVADVKAKADVLTKGFGIKITGVQSVSESGSYYPPSPMYRSVAEGSMKADTTIISGDLQVTVSVSVVYLIE